MSEPLRVIVAGASGFIGQRAVVALRGAGHAVAELRREDIAALTHSPSAAGIHSIGSRLDAAFAGSDAARVLVWAAGKRESDLAANREIHARAPLDVRDALVVSRVVYLSTGEVYGDAPLPYRETGPTNGTSEYARAKLEGEAALLGPGPASAAVLRLALVYGPGSKPPMLIPRVAAALRAGERMAMTRGEQTRDLVFVDDVAAAIVAAAESAEVGIFNIGSGVETRIKDVILGIADAIASEGGRTREQLAELLGFGEVALRPDEAHRYVMDISRARDVLGWRATTALADGLARL